MFSILSARPSSDNRTVVVDWSDGHTSRFHAKWLRFYCRCKRCQPELKGTYLVDILAFPDVLTVAKVDVDKKGKGISIEMREEILPDHVIWFGSQWLRERCYCDECLDDVIELRDVISKKGMAAGCKTIPFMDYQKLLDDPDRNVYKWLSYIVEQGYCVIKNFPSGYLKVCELAKMLGPLRSTSYGPTIEVNLSEKEHGTNNGTRLPFHQDQACYETPPGLALIHCQKFDDSITGGETKLTDFFLVAETLRKESPEDFKTLTEVPGSWDTHNDHLSYPTHQEHQKCHIILDYFGKVVGVNWSAQLSSPIRVREKDVERYFKAQRKFMEISEREENQIVFRMQPGDVITINNRRCGHMRERFEAGNGRRELSAAFVNIDDVKSGYIHLGNKLGFNPVPPKVGNTSSF